MSRYSKYNNNNSFLNKLNLFTLLDGNDDHEEEFKTPSSAYQHTFRTPETQKKTRGVSSDTSDEDPATATVYLTPQPPTNVQVC